LLLLQEPFEVLVRRAISRLEGPSLACKDLVHDELLRIASQAAPSKLARRAESLQ
jgi:dynamin 1-like protein